MRKPKKVEDPHKPVMDAYGEEVHMFLHTHLRGYDLTGCGKEMSGHYFDKYGSPVSHESSWSEGYRDIEKQLFLHLDQCANPCNELPLLAGFGGGCHLYKPIKHHDNEPWNVTGWVPLENKWCCEERFFRNRHFFALRGNEIQNDMWDYHPYKSDWQVHLTKDEQKWIQDRIDSGEEIRIPTEEELNKYADRHTNEEERKDGLEPFHQFVPVGAYKGGYWYKDDVRGRYLHIIALKSHQKNDKGHYERYNYIVHPLAYRTSINDRPDNSVDGMQWCITNIINEEHFVEEKKLERWGEKNHGLEIFNDFVYFYSWQPLHADGITDCEDVNLINNGTLSNYDKESLSSRYRFWFNTYPLEFGEFLLDSALTMGTYLHPTSANDAFYDRKIVPLDELDEDAEGMEAVLLSDPKGAIIKRIQSIKRQRGETKIDRMREAVIARLGKEEAAPMKSSCDFKEHKPYRERTVFGYTTLIDTMQELKECMEKNPPADNIYDEESDWDTGLNIVEPNVIRRLQDGQFFSHTGVFDIFAYLDKDKEDGQIIPWLIKGKSLPKGQKRETQLCYEIKNKRELVFTFERTRKLEEIQKEVMLIWKYTIQTVVSQEPAKVQTSHGYFQLSTSKKTQLNLSQVYEKDNVSWIRFSAFNPSNPMRRAWFMPIKGPAFPKDAGKIVDIADTMPQMSNRIMKTERHSSNEDFDIVQEVGEFKPCAIKTADMDFVLDKCNAEEEDDMYSYFFQSYPVKQPIKKSLGSLFSKPKDDNPNEPFAPRIMESVHGYFSLGENYPSRFRLSDSWDPTSLVDGEVYVYAIDNITAQPKDVKHLVLDGLPERCKSSFCVKKSS